MGDSSCECERARVVIHGLVQGLGFRPFIYQLATALNLSGWVRNIAQGVEIEVEGDRDAVQVFILRLQDEPPTLAVIQSLESVILDPAGYTDFAILASDATGPRRALVMPDIATCPVCLHELFDPKNRRYRYPFINCTHCGPRFSIIESLPYDRVNTTMRHFPMCPACRAEYENPADRRFHAEPNACATCGPSLAWWSGSGEHLSTGNNAVRDAIAALRNGSIVAVKGIGGFQLLADARNESALKRLRERKHRDAKPLALMFPSLASVQEEAEVASLEQRILTSPAAPIVILVRKASCNLPSAVAPDNDTLGVMLPYSPLHHLLLRDFGGPVVATSGNRADEPICIDEQEALARLGGIAEFFLVHNRPVTRHVDDSIVRVLGGRESVLRRARGYAPLPVTLSIDAPPLLATGGHLKNTVAVADGRNVFLSQHIGDLETQPAFEAFVKAAQDMQALCDIHPGLVVSDQHPDYASTRWSARSGITTEHVQHHHAHIAACMAEHDLEGPVLGVAWDGTGYGTDGTIWGGEFLHTTQTDFVRCATLRTFRLPGGEKAVREPLRSALGVLHAIMGAEALDALKLQDGPALLQLLDRGFMSPVTTSAGRLFDAVAGLLDLCDRITFEGQAAMALEHLAGKEPHDQSYRADLTDQNDVLTIDWEPMLRQILRDRDKPAWAAAAFHNTMSEAIVTVAKRMMESHVVLSGGCFQNKLLLERTIRRLREEGFEPYWHQRVPPNDGGIALGQAFVAAQRSVKRL